MSSVAIAVADPTSTGESASSHAVRNSLAALRLIVGALRDGVILATPESGPRGVDVGYTV